MCSSVHYYKYKSCDVCSMGHNLDWNGYISHFMVVRHQFRLSFQNQTGRSKQLIWLITGQMLLLPPSKMTNHRIGCLRFYFTFTFFLETMSHYLIGVLSIDQHYSPFSFLKGRLSKIPDRGAWIYEVPILYLFLISSLFCSN